MEKYQEGNYISISTATDCLLPQSASSLRPRSTTQNLFSWQEMWLPLSKGSSSSPYSFFSASKDLFFYFSQQCVVDALLHANMPERSRLLSVPCSPAFLVEWELYPRSRIPGP